MCLWRERLFLISKRARMSIKGDNSNGVFSDPLSAQRNILLFEARVTERACRFDEMASCMKKILEIVSGDDLTPEELELFSSAFKNRIRARRNSWKIVSAQVQKELTSGRLRWAAVNQNYLVKIEGEICRISNEILRILEKHLRPRATTPALTKVYFYKMKGDYHRYMAEFTTANTKLSMIDNCQSAYNAALHLAFSELNPIHPLRLNLLLNVGVFYHEIRGDPQSATRLVCSAFKDAIPMLPGLKDRDPQSRESWSALVLLKDYYVCWSTDLKYQDHNSYEESYTMEDEIE